MKAEVQGPTQTTKSTAVSHHRTTPISRMSLARTHSGISMKNVFLRLLGLPRSTRLTRFEVIRDATSEEPDFVEALRSKFGIEQSIAKLYLFRGNINEVANVLVIGLVPGWRGLAKPIRDIDALWKSQHGGLKLLAIQPLDVEMEERVMSTVEPFFTG